jgi:putative membrane protein
MRNTSLSIGVVILIVLLVLFFGGMGMMGFGGFGRGPGMMNGGMMGGVFNPLGGLLSLLVGALLIGGIVFVAVSLVRSNNVMTPIAPPRESPLDVLKVRYSKGEITKEQYDQMRKDLEG